MKGVILAGGHGTRLYPLTSVVCKQLLPVYDKPMVYYPLSILMLAGISEILIISTPHDVPRFQSLLGTGHQLGVSLSYAIQDSPRGLADAFIVGAEFIGASPVCLILGDNIFYGHGLPERLRLAAGLESGAVIFGYNVKDPQRYGVIEFDGALNVVSIEEKPEVPKSSYAVVGLYFYDNSVVETAMRLAPSSRGELEITDVNKEFLTRGQLRVELLGRGCAWLDTGTQESLVDASLFVKTIEERQGLKISCIEEIAFKMGYIDESQLIRLAEPIRASSYGQYLLSIIPG